MTKLGFKYFFLSFLMLINTSAFGAGMTHIYVVSDKNFVGDRNNMLGVSRETVKYFENHQRKAQFHEYDYKNLSEVKDKIRSENTRVVLISCGEYGISAIKDIKGDEELKHKVIAVHLSHQVLNGTNAKHKDIVNSKKNDGADIIALPSHVVGYGVKRGLANKYTKLVETVGVAHNLEVDAIKKAYSQNQHALPRGEKFMAIILPGDAPDSRGKMHLYGASEAAKMAEYISKVSRKGAYTVLITNGPRTGKHDNSGFALDVHNNNGKIDPVTLKFVEILSRDKAPFRLYDFQKGQPSFKELILGAVLYNEGSKIFVPGESTSVVSECLDVLPKEKVIIYHNSAMNKAHHKHVETEFSNGRADVMDMKMNTSASSAKSSTIKSAREVVAETIYERLQLGAIKKA